MVSAAQLCLDCHPTNMGNAQGQVHVQPQPTSEHNQHKDETNGRDPENNSPIESMAKIEPGQNKGSGTGMDSDSGIEVCKTEAGENMEGEAAVMESSPMLSRHTIKSATPEANRRSRPESEIPGMVNQTDGSEPIQMPLPPSSDDGKISFPHDLSPASEDLAKEIMTCMSTVEVEMTVVGEDGMKTVVSTPRCPIDQKTVDRDKVFVDKTCTKEIEALAVKCASHKSGCKWRGVLKEFYPHYEDCKYLTIPCPKKCGADFEKRFLDKHLKDDCPKRDMGCEFCKEQIAADEEITHLNVCKRFPIPCPNGCKKKEIPREELDDHMENNCSKQGIPCPFSECGCEHRCARKEMNKHIRDEPIKHLTLIGQTILAHKKTLELHSEVMDAQNEKLDKASKRVDGLEKLYGSQLIWKIDGYAAKLEEAKAGKKPTIFSPPFLTSRHGYKMALSCCLYGDGKARGKNFSVFVCICKGEYDALLPWPFAHRVTFTLVDQCADPEARRNITYSVKPNTCKENKAFLGRPSGERNASFGAQKFCDINALDSLDYIRDDIMFIKINIDMDDMVLL